MFEQTLRTIGVIAAPHGLQGTVRVDPLSDFPERFLHLKTCFLRRKDGSIVELVVKQTNLATRPILMTFESICDRNDAELLRGCEICVAEADTWELPEDTYYITDIIGYSVISEAGQPLGELENVIRGAQDIFQIRGPFGEILVPFVKEWVGEIDEKERTICVLNWEQLVDLGARDEESSES
jgi:16S rRNA processing protein RimM